jgi:hypothetical protein
MNLSEVYKIVNVSAMSDQRVLRLVDLNLTPENMTNFEEMINNERAKYTSRVHNHTHFYVEFLTRSNFRYNNHTYSSQNVNKMIYFTFDDIKKEWKIRSTGRH